MCWEFHEIRRAIAEVHRDRHAARKRPHDGPIACRDSHPNSMSPTEPPARRLERDDDIAHSRVGLRVGMTIRVREVEHASRHEDRRAVR